MFCRALLLFAPVLYLSRRLSASRSPLQALDSSFLSITPQSHTPLPLARRPLLLSSLSAIAPQAEEDHTQTASAAAAAAAAAREDAEGDEEEAKENADRNRRWRWRCSTCRRRRNWTTASPTIIQGLRRRR